jgi:hypothetical protein
MPACLSMQTIFLPRKFKLALILFFLLTSPLFFFGQSLTGLWTGALSNDSNTVRKDQLFEIVLTEYRGKVYGYSRSEFIVNDTLYYIVKRVKGTITGDVCEVTDDDIISYNFRGKLDKGVKVTSTFRRNQTDSTWYLEGTWKTNATKKYYAVSGKVDLESEKDLAKSKIFPHLEELKKADEFVFYKEKQEGSPVVKIARPQKIKTEYSDKDLAVANEKQNIAAPEIQKTSLNTGPAVSVSATAQDPGEEEIKKDPQPISKPEHDLPKTETKNTTLVNGSASVKPVIRSAPKDEPPAPVKTNPAPTEMTAYDNSWTPEKTTPVVTVKKDPPPVIQNNAVKQTEPVVTAKNKTVPKQDPTQKDISKPAENIAKNKPVIQTENKPAPLNTSQPVTTAPATVTKPVVKRSIEEITKKDEVIAGRKSEFAQVVNFKSDSLELSLYDNGEIDGDTVSVIMNGQVLIAKQGLKANAFKKTIYIKPGDPQDFTLVLFAENLGKYPPNTGLLVVHDGEDIYHLRFSSDFQKSTGIVFRKNQ